MAARLNRKQDERSRSAIKTTQLLKRLNAFALGEKDEAGNVVEIDTTRLRAIEILLKKTLPDLQSIQHGNDPDNPLTNPKELSDEELAAIAAGSGKGASET